MWKLIHLPQFSTPASDTIEMYTLCPFLSGSVHYQFPANPSQCEVNVCTAEWICLLVINDVHSPSSLTLDLFNTQTSCFCVGEAQILRFAYWALLSQRNEALGSSVLATVALNTQVNGYSSGVLFDSGEGEWWALLIELINFSSRSDALFPMVTSNDTFV